MRVRPLLLTGALLVAGLGAPGLAADAPAPAAPGTTVPSDALTGDAGGRLGLGPATGGAPDTRTALSYGVTPGGSLRDGLAVSNTGPAPLEVTLAVVGARSADGALAPATAAPQPGAPLDAAAGWLALEGPTTVTVPADGVLVVPIALAVPADARPGDHAAFVTARGGEAVVAVPASFRVSGESRAQLVVADLRVEHDASAVPFTGGATTAVFTVRNTGTERLGGSTRLRTAGLLTGGDEVAGPVVPALLPGEQVELRAAADGPPADGRVTATVSLTALALDGTAVAGAEVASTGSALAFPWSALLLLLLLVAVAVLLLRRRGSARPAAPAPTPAADAAARRGRAAPSQPAHLTGSRTSAPLTDEVSR